MNKPIRIQRKRTKGWKMPPNTVYVGRPTKWGNPYSNKYDFKYWLLGGHAGYGYCERRQIILDSIHELSGKNLACWCKISDPCHADVLLELANR